MSEQSLSSPARFDDDVLAAWRVLTDRGLIKIEWAGMLPDVVLPAGLLDLHIAANAASRPHSFEGWTEA